MALTSPSRGGLNYMQTQINDYFSNIPKRAIWKILQKNRSRYSFALWVLQHLLLIFQTVIKLIYHITLIKITEIRILNKIYKD